MKISIITISYNSEDTIEKTFKSILTQKYRPLEYVLVDGGSSDSTVNLIENYLPVFRESGIEVNFVSERDNGISDAFNKGIKRATGELIGIINSDDQLVDNILQNVMDKLKETTDVVFGNCLWNDSENNISYIRKSSTKLAKLRYTMVIMHPTCLVKKRAYEEWGGFDVTLKCVMDKDIMARFYKNGAKFQYLNEVISVMSSGGISDTDTDRVFEEGIEVAVRYDVNRIIANIYFMYKKNRLKFVKFIKIHNLLKKRGIKLLYDESETAVRTEEKL